jgi:hypothetical protein
MKISRPKKKPIIVILVKRTVFFFLTMCFLTLFLYGIGTAQEFMDITQLLLLHLAMLLGIFLAAASVYGMILDFWLVFHNRKFRYLYGAGAYLFLGLFGVLITVLTAFIMAAAEGNML